MAHGKNAMMPQLQRDAEKLIRKTQKATVKTYSRKRTRKNTERLLIPLAVLAIFGNGLLNFGEAMNGNAAAGMIALQSIALSFFVALVEYDRSEYHRKSKPLKNGPVGALGARNAISHGLTAGLVGERRARGLVTKPTEYGKVLMFAAFESLALGWVGLVTSVVVGLRAAFLLR